MNRRDTSRTENRTLVGGISRTGLRFAANQSVSGDHEISPLIITSVPVDVSGVPLPRFSSFVPPNLHKERRSYFETPTRKMRCALKSIPE